jgi:hypothetical protein
MPLLDQGKRGAADKVTNSGSAEKYLKRPLRNIRLHPYQLKENTLLPTYMLWCPLASLGEPPSGRVAKTPGSAKSALRGKSVHRRARRRDSAIVNVRGKR